MPVIDSSDKKLLNSTKGFPMTSTNSALHPTYCLFLNNKKHLSIVKLTRCLKRTLLFQNLAVLFILKTGISDQAFAACVPTVIRNIGKKSKSVKIKNHTHAKILNNNNINNNKNNKTTNYEHLLLCSGKISVGCCEQTNKHQQKGKAT